MKIISMKSENVKRIKVVEITPTGNMVVVGGQNGQGKTSALDSIMYTLAGNKSVCDKPLRNGETKGEVEIVINHPKGNIIVKRTFTEKGGSITIANDEGMRYTSPQNILDKLTGKLTFDPVSFMNLDRKKQFEALRELIGIDFTKADEKRKIAYDERTIANRQLRTASDKVNDLTEYKEVDEPIDTDVVVDQLKRSMKANKARDDKLRLTETMESKLYETKCRICEFTEEIETLRTKIRDNENTAEEMKADIQKAVDDIPEVIDVEPLQEQLNNAKKTNAVYRKHEDYLAARAEYDKQDGLAKRLTIEIEGVDAWKADQLAGAKFPVAGLSFVDDTVMFDGVPLDQASGAEQLRVSAAMAAAMNPELRVMLIRDGSLLDNKSLKLLADFADENDMQIWLERVGEGEECSVIIEDGMVKAKEEPDIMLNPHQNQKR